MPQRGIEENGPRRREVAEMLREDAAKNFFDAPLGHGPFGGATGGRSRCAGLPPANFLRGPSGTKSEALATILWSSAGGHGSTEILAGREIFSGARLCARSTSRRGRL